jgi:glutamine cyclotransferase
MATNRRKGEAKADRKTASPLKAVMAGGVLLLAGLLCWATLRPALTGQSSKQDLQKPEGASSSVPAARQLSYEVVGSFPHDPTAFLQGLVWHEGGFYESTGLEGHSTLRRVEFSSGQVVKSVRLAPDLFGEGLALVDNRLILLTWRSHRGFVYDRETFRLLREFNYATEGWGLTYDGKNLIMSDGSDVLTYLDSETFQPTRKLPVTMNGRPLANLNELEFIEGEIWSNVWQTDVIVRIDPNTGKAGSFVNLRGILAPGLRRGNEDVLNGIAYDRQAKRLFVGGKLWPRIFEIRVHP